jgi:hypothetical protein
MDLYSFISECDSLNLLTMMVLLQLFQTLSSNRFKPSNDPDYRQFALHIFFHLKSSHILSLFLEGFLGSSLWIPLADSLLMVVISFSQSENLRQAVKNKAKAR